MAALFTKRSNMRLRLALGGALLLGLGTPSFLMAWVRSPQVTGQHQPVSQPVQFDHRHHVLDAGVDCLYCHSTAERSRNAGVPATRVCMGCHAQVWNDSALLEPVQRSWFDDRPIAWNRVHQLPGFVYFDHSIHLHKGVGCVECHGRVDLMAQVEQVAPLTMQWCLDCHRSPDEHLRPRASITRMEPLPERDRERAGSELARLYHVEHVTHCSACHR
jgi:hypothetical protein